MKCHILFSGEKIKTKIYFKISSVDIFPSMLSVYGICLDSPIEVLSTLYLVKHFTMYLSNHFNPCPAKARICPAFENSADSDHN